MPTTFNLAESRGKHTRSGRQAYTTNMQGNATVGDYDRTAYTTGNSRMYVRRGRKAYLDGRSAP